jgi:hypothetical protein
VLCSNAVERLVKLQLLVWATKKSPGGPAKEHRALRSSSFLSFTLSSFCLHFVFFFVFLFAFRFVFEFVVLLL